MNHNERILHILDQSTCLTRRQMKDYLGGTMLPEEIHAAEMHIASCPLCSMALDGFEAHSDEALEAIASLNSGFLKEHFDAITPKIHLNSLAPAAGFTGRRKKTKQVSLLRISGVAAAVLIGFGLIWYMSHRDGVPAERAIALNQKSTSPAVAPAATMKNTPPEPAATPLPAERPSIAAANTQPVVKPAAEQPLPGAPSPAAKATMPAAELAAAPIAATVAKDTVTAESAKWSADQMATTTAGTYAPSSSGISIGGGRVGNGSTYIVDDVRVQNNVQAKKMARPLTTRSKAEVAADEPDNDYLERGDAFYGKSKYSSALSQYQKEMAGGDRRRRGQATIMAARCYYELGNRQKAISLLQSMQNESGPNKRAARRLLREWGE